MIEVFSDKSLAQEYSDLAEYCNQFLKDISAYEDFYFLNLIDLTVTLQHKKAGNATRESVLGHETVLINPQFLMHVRLIFRRILMSEFATLDQRCDGILQSLQKISTLQLNHWSSFLPGVRLDNYSFNARQRESLRSNLTPKSDLLNTINEYMLTNSKKFDEWWNLFAIFIILHEVGHILWNKGIKDHKFWSISQDIIQDKRDYALSNPYRTPAAAKIIGDPISNDDTNNSILEEVFCDSIASGACSLRLNKLLNVEEMRCALLMYGDIFRFLSAIDEVVQQDYFNIDAASVSNSSNLSSQRSELFRDLLDYLVSEKGIWPKYTQYSGGARTHVYTSDNYFRSFWATTPFSFLPFSWRRVSKTTTLTDKEVNQIAAELGMSSLLIENFIYADNFLSECQADRYVFARELSMRYREWLILKQLISDGRAHEYSHTLSLQRRETTEEVLDLRTRAEVLDLIHKGMFSAAESYWREAKKSKFHELNRAKVFDQFDELNRVELFGQTRLKFKNREYALYLEISGKIAQMHGAYASSAISAQETYELVENDTLLSQYKARYLYDIAYAKWRKGSRDDDDSAIQESIQISKQAEKSAAELGHFLLSFRIKYLTIESCKWLAMKKRSEEDLEMAIMLLKEIETALEGGEIGNMFDIGFIRDSISELQSISSNDCTG
ncbi:MAG: hypothetical protein HC840_02205 [Leptolyngbyaceae cyanobacterium RM2_2_4]|nr:hypothetical protein [Leptolyngbyaceae cyanobacterium RM2_2_4]